MKHCSCSRLTRVGFFFVLPAILYGLLTAGASGAASFSPDDFEVYNRPDLPPAYVHAENKTFLYEQSRDADSEPTPNMEQYDALYYDLSLSIDPVLETVEGEVDAIVRVVSGTLTTLEFNLYDNMVVSGCSVSGSPATFWQAADILTIDLDGSYGVGAEIPVSIAYEGTPAPSAGAFSFDHHAGLDLVWSLSEPFGARTWWPCKDFSHDKPDSMDIRLNVPDDMIAASNGLLRATIDENDGTTTYWWHEGYPIATYLVSLAVYAYETYSDYYYYSPSDSMEIRHFVYPDHMSRVEATYGLVPGMMAIYSDLYGEYPFLDEKYGHAEFGWPGGMEHQTMTSLGGWSEYLIAHELAHMWWGDMITCNDFHHIWLNEGFATYSEALYTEAVYGVEAYKEDMHNARYLGAGTIYVPDLSDWNRIFHGGLSYNKGSWILHMLRRVTGDDTFFDILKAYYQDTRYQYGSATTEEFRDICEDVSGLDLDGFFEQWIYGEYYPVYSYSWEAGPDGDGYVIDLTISQSQSGTFFEMPIDIEVVTGGGSEVFVVQNTEQSQQFELHTVAEPLDLLLDPDEWILKLAYEPVTDPSFNSGILVVNGVAWGTYGSEIYSAYEDSIFTGTLPFRFWDLFDPGAYPDYLPEPLGHGPVPAGMLKRFSTIVWIGNNYFGDLPHWLDTPVFPYLEAGGNLLLMARMGQDFMISALKDYLGLTWMEASMNTLGNCEAVHEGLVDMPFAGMQSYCAVFDTAFTQPESELLYIDAAGFGEPRGISAWRAPAGGGEYKPEGGRAAFVSARPYRFDHATMRANNDYILRELLLEPWVLAVEVTPEGSVSPGEVLGFDYSITNRSLGMVECEAWLAALRPGGLPMPGGPVAGPVQIELDPDQTLSGTIGVEVPLYAPPAEGYTLVLRTGIYPEVWAEDTGIFNIVD